MCGIAGIFNYNVGQAIDSAKLVKMGKAIAHRGPDGFGNEVLGHAGLAHRRLSILDLSTAGQQPMQDNSGRYVISYNGEIYNYRELREGLKQQGVQFRSETDTEVLLELYAREGLSMLDKLNGMFAFAIYDRKERDLVIVRDRLGIKPLFWTSINDQFLFGSEPKALFAGGFEPEYNPEVGAELLIHKYVAGERTVYKNVFRLLPGHYMRVTLQNSTPEFKRYWDLPSIVQERMIESIENPMDWFENTFTSAVNYRTISDVPIGVMLSGGLDSSSIAAVLGQSTASRNLNAFTVAFKERAYDESHLAAEVCQKFGLNFNKIYLEGSELDKALSDASELYDEPLVHQNDAQMLALAQLAKKKVTVLLSGEGGDELLGGYVRYKPLKYFNAIYPLRSAFQLIGKYSKGGIVNRFDKLSRFLSLSSIDRAVLYNATDIYPGDLALSNDTFENSLSPYRIKVLEEAKRVFPNDPSRQSMYCDMFIHMASVLDRNDRMTMGAGIECRVPFMDFRIVEGALSLPSNILLKGKKGKYILANTIGKKLPPSILSFKKLGFSVPWESNFGANESYQNFIHSGYKQNLLVQQFDLARDFEDSKSPVNEMLKRRLFMVDKWQKSVFHS
jgi:asparagine synthase (glutamine-hydrolysing)